MSDEFGQTHKPHRKRQSGPKASKKKSAKSDFFVNEKQSKKDAASTHKNPKAFTFNSAVRAERSVRRCDNLVGDLCKMQFIKYFKSRRCKREENSHPIS